MAAAAEELHREFLGAFVDRVHQPDELLVVLAFSGRGARRHWLLSCDARWPRSHETRRRRNNPPNPPAFCMLLRKYLEGSRLVEVEQVRFDRILRLTFRRGDETCILVHEVMGRHSNLLLLGADQKILGAVKLVSPDQTRVRPVAPGLAYHEPPGERPDPRGLSRMDLEVLFREQEVRTPERLTRSLSGWGTFPAREVFLEVEARMAGDRAEPDLQDLPNPPDVAASLAESVHRRMERVRQGNFAPHVLLDEHGRARGIWAFASHQPGWTDGRVFPGISAACDAYFAELEETHARETLRKSLVGALERALRTTELQRSEAQGFLDRLAQNELLRIQGELVAAHAGQIERGAERVELPNWYDPSGGALSIALDPELSARENADRFFQRYRRGVAGAEAALDRVPELEARIAELERELAEAQVAEHRRLEELWEDARRRGLFREVSTRGKDRSEGGSEFPTGVRVKRFTMGNWEIVWGENATSNDYLTMRWARPGDLWLHARAITGAHVIVRGVETLDRLPPEVLREAARRAAAHSEGRHSAVVAVDYTFRRYVRKPKGSAPGAVTYVREKTLHIDPRSGQ